MRSERGALPDPTLIALVESTAAVTRSARDLRDALGVVLDHVATAAGWQAGHALVPAPQRRTWESAGLWFPDDGIGLGGLRHACVTAPAGPPRGHRALALEVQGTRWSADLRDLGAAITDAAAAAGIRSAVACPVVVRGEPVALLEWFVASAARPAPDVAHVLGHLSGVLAEVADRAVYATV